MYYQGQDGYREGGSPHSSVPPTRYIPGLGVEKGGANKIADTICPVRPGSRPNCAGSCGGGCTTKVKMGTGRVVHPTHRWPDTICPVRPFVFSVGKPPTKPTVSEQTPECPIPEDKQLCFSPSRGSRFVSPRYLSPRYCISMRVASMAIATSFAIFLCSRAVLNATLRVCTCVCVCEHNTMLFCLIDRTFPDFVWHSRHIN